MPPRDTGLAVSALVGFTAISSFLGLSGRFLVGEPGQALGFMAGIWRASAAADAVFVVGSMLAATLAFVLARRPGFHVGVAIIVSLGANWLVYYASFVLLPDAVSEGSGANALRALWFVAAWGAPGLLFAMLAPPLAALWWERATSDADEDPLPA